MFPSFSRSRRGVICGYYFCRFGLVYFDAHHAWVATILGGILEAPGCLPEVENSEWRWSMEEWLGALRGVYEDLPMKTCRSP